LEVSSKEIDSIYAVSAVQHTALTAVVLARQRIRALRWRHPNLGPGKVHVLLRSWCQQCRLPHPSGLSVARRALETYEAPPMDATIAEELREFVAKREAVLPG